MAPLESAGTAFSRFAAGENGFFGARALEKSARRPIVTGVFFVGLP